MAVFMLVVNFNISISPSVPEWHDADYEQVGNKAS